MFLKFKGFKKINVIFIPISNPISQGKKEAIVTTMLIKPLVNFILFYIY